MYRSCFSSCTCVHVSILFLLTINGGGMVESAADPVDGLEGVYVDGSRGGVQVSQSQLPVLVGSE